jgi:hypothetical protein
VRSQATRRAQTDIREWSSIPVSALAQVGRDSEGTGFTRRLDTSNTNRRGPQYGRERRNSNNAASTCAGI